MAKCSPTIKRPIGHIAKRAVLLASLLLTALSLGLTSSSLVFAQSGKHAVPVDSEWWFDIELIAFKREILPNQPEDFSEADFNFTPALPFDLFSIPLLKAYNPYFRLQASLASCDISDSNESDNANKIHDGYFNPIPAIKFMPQFTLKVDSMSALLDKEITPRPLRRINQFLEDAAEFGEFILPIENAVLYADNRTADLFEVSTNAASMSADVHWFLSAYNTSFDIQTIYIPEKLHLKCLDPQLTPLVYEPFERVPESFFASKAYQFGNHAILQSEAKYLSDYAKRLFSQRDIQPLIYTAWRQPVVFGEDKASYYKILAGERLKSTPAQQRPELAGRVSSKSILKAANADAEDENAPSISEILNSLQASLRTPKPIEWDEQNESEKASNENEENFEHFELEGLFKVYLEYVSRVPYLHIDSEFKHYRVNIEADGEMSLQQYPFKQRRRIISKQIHYFDHPAFGVLVRLERYEKPDVIDIEN
uniref:CsiV family protein n=1 Tax=Ningiella ruwaisensis TaxID=2364274 RepID=UPI0010A06C1E|nr:CsiV family protein [Ningiella ruwaisensis]